MFKMKFFVKENVIISFLFNNFTYNTSIQVLIYYL